MASDPPRPWRQNEKDFRQYAKSLNIKLPEQTTDEAMKWVIQEWERAVQARGLSQEEEDDSDSDSDSDTSDSVSRSDSGSSATSQG